ncbi:MAG: LLM class flavin-dependent oxidoreductase [Acidimicrobiales bacterium]
MKLGVTLPQFSGNAGIALEAARHVDEIGLDGVFVFDHLWPIGQPHRPALSAFPLLGALAAQHRRLTMGTLVARIGLLPDPVLISSLRTMTLLAPGRFIAGLGVGDRMSRGENLAFGLPFPDPAERLDGLERCVADLSSTGIPIWVGVGRGRDQALVEVARRHGATVNLWGSSIGSGQLAGLGTGGPVCWGGDLPDDPTALFDRLEELEAAGASWAVAAWPGDRTGLDNLARAALR